MKHSQAFGRIFRVGIHGLAIIVTVGATSAVSAARSGQTSESILTAARQFLVEQLEHTEGKLQIEMSRIDPRLRLPGCLDKLQIEAPQKGRLLGKVSLRVSCNEASSHKPWSIFVSARVTLLQTVYIAQGYIPRGKPIAVQQVRLDERDVARLRNGFFSRPEQINGMIARQTIAPGQVLTSYLLKPPTLIKRGQTIAIIARQGDLVVRMKGKALASGAAGERIQVKNATSKRIVEGLITPEGEVSIPL